MHYYHFDENQLVENPKMAVTILPDNLQIFKEMAREMIETIEENNLLQQSSVLIVPVGPVGQYSYFVEEVNTRQISLKKTWFINMDEYVVNHEWIDQKNLLSFRKFMNEEVYAKIDANLIMPVQQRVFPNPNDIEEIPTLLAQLGKIDLVIGGIGVNGHVAFNEPNSSLTVEEYLQLPTRLQEIAFETRVVNAVASLHGAYELMPTMCVTVGMKEIYSAKKIRLGVFRDWHRSVIRKALYAEPTTAFPVTLLQSHENIQIYCTKFVAQLSDSL
ncbi:MAG: glucosamine-6-phosphate isomerase [Solibacillus sp.]